MKDAVTRKSIQAGKTLLFKLAGECPDWVESRIVAVALLTDDDVTRLGSSFQRLWPVDEAPCFAGLLEAIDDADRALRQSRAEAPTMRVRRS